MFKNNKAFTLVELIVVITILAILGTIAFLSLQGYSRDARDSVRISDLNNISRGMEFMLTKTGRLPVPDDNVEITASGTTILYQGYAGENVLGIIGVNNGGKDPKEDTFYTYSSNSNYNKYQLLGFLENGDQIGLLNNNSVNADLSERFPMSEGNELGIITDIVTNEPLQMTGTGIDIVNTTNQYQAILSTGDTFTGTGKILEKSMMHVIAEKGSCHSILKNGYDLETGNVDIIPRGNSGTTVYCDMDTDGGGWTKILKIGDLNPGTNIDTYAQVGYEIDHSDLNIPFSRIAYKIYLDGAYAWTSFDDMTGGDLKKIGLPVDWIYGQSVNNLFIESNSSNVQSKNKTSGRIEFWSSCYGSSPGLYDYDDGYPISQSLDCYGSFQVHEFSNNYKGTIWAYNRWSSSALRDIGIGNRPTDNPDWTFAANGNSFLDTYIEIYVK